MGSREAELEQQQRYFDLPVFTAFVPDNVMHRWMCMYDILVEYHGERDAYVTYIVDEWRQRYPLMAVNLANEQLAKVSAQPNQELY